MTSGPHKSDFEKAIEVAGVLLRMEGSRTMSRLRLIKLIYIANRRAIKELGRPILRSPIFAMKHGPVHDEVYKMISENHPAAGKWATFISRQGQRDLHLDKQPAVKKLSTSEIAILQKVSDELATLDDWSIADLTHQFDEWRRHYPDPTENTSRPIPLEDVVSVGSG